MPRHFALAAEKALGAAQEASNAAARVIYQLRSNASRGALVGLATTPLPDSETLSGASGVITTEHPFGVVILYVLAILLGSVGTCLIFWAVSRSRDAMHQKKDLLRSSSSENLATLSLPPRDPSSPDVAGAKGKSHIDSSAGMREILVTKISIFLLFVPIGWASHFLKWGDTATFVLNLMAILPLANLMNIATEELAAHTGQIVGGLLNATFGNAVELIVVVQSLNIGLLAVVKGTLLGSILSNMLLVLGMAFLFGGLRGPDGSGVRNRFQSFSAPAGVVQAQLLLFCSVVVSLPSVFAKEHNVKIDHVVTMSRLASPLILVVYGVYLFFQLHTHADVMSEGEEEEQVIISSPVAMTMLAAVTCLVAVCSEFLVHAIEGFTAESGLSKTFVGVILLPIVGNACEHTTAIVVALKDKMDLSIGIALGSTCQIALFGIPFAVLWGWAMDKPMTLDFEEVNAWAMTLSSLLVVVVLSQGKSTWLSGFLLVAAYITLAVMFFCTPDDAIFAG